MTPVEEIIKKDIFRETPLRYLGTYKSRFLKSEKS